MIKKLIIVLFIILLVIYGLFLFVTPNESTNQNTNGTLELPYNKQADSAMAKSRAMNNSIVKFPSNDYSDTLTADILIQDNNGLDILLMGKDNTICKLLYDNKQWEPNLQTALKRLLKPNDKVLVLGAHIGTHAILISKLIGKHGHIAIFEANPHVLKFLRANLALNDIKNAVLYPVVAFSHNTEIPFISLEEGDTGNSHIMKEGDYFSDQVIKITAKAIDSITEIQSIDVLQMDIGGDETTALKGAIKLIDNSPNLLVFQEWSVKLIDNKDGDYLKFWQARGFEFAKITEDKLIKIKEEELRNISNDQIMAIILSKNIDEVINKYNNFKE